MQKDLEEKKRRAATAAGVSSSGRAAVNAGGGQPGGSSSSSKGRLDHWLMEGIVVKVLSKALKEDGYYKQKVSQGAADTCDRLFVQTVPVTSGSLVLDAHAVYVQCPLATMIAHCGDHGFEPDLIRQPPACPVGWKHY